jgi:translocation protein SEC66
MIDWVGLLIPLAYLSILIGSLATFSSLYRRRKAQKSASLAPWFPPHLQRNIYLSLLHIDPQDSSSTPEGSEKSLNQIPDSIIRAALLRRAVEDIHRIIQIRNAKPALQTLLQRGSVGDELWQRFLRAEQEIEEEVKDVVSEVCLIHHQPLSTFWNWLESQANALVPNWGQIIFQSANEIANNQLAKQRMEDIQSKLPEEKAWWDKRKQGVQSAFMKELDNEAAGST